MNCECTWQLQPSELQPSVGIASSIMTIHATLLQEQIAQFSHSDTTVCPVLSGPQKPPATACSRNRSLSCRSYSFSSSESDSRNRVAWTKALRALISILLLVRGVVVVPKSTVPEQTSNTVYHSHCVGSRFNLNFASSGTALGYYGLPFEHPSNKNKRLITICTSHPHDVFLGSNTPPANHASGDNAQHQRSTVLQNRKNFDNLACEECTRSLFWIEHVTRKKCVVAKISHGNLNRVSSIAIFSSRIAGRKLRAISSQIDQSTWLLLKLFPHLEIIGRKFDDHRYEAFQLFRVHRFSCVGARSISPHIFQCVVARSSDHLSVLPRVNCMTPFRKSHSWLVSFLARWLKIRFTLSLSEPPRENSFNNDVGPSHLAEVSPLRS